jgi:hypothetical protein
LIPFHIGFNHPVHCWCCIRHWLRRRLEDRSVAIAWQSLH